MSRSLSFRADIQGLRAIAVLAVMLFHYNRQLLPGGFIGVDIFFVISGFLITSILLKKKDNPNFSLFYILKSFYLGRIIRIAPAYYVLLVVVSLVSAVIFIPADYSFFHNSLKKSLRFMSNQYFSGFGDYFAPNSDELPLLHTWSLAIEMQFYLFYPFLVLFLSKKWLKIIIPVIIFALFAISAYQLKEGLVQGVYYGLYARIPEFLIGSCVVLFVQQINKIQVTWLPIVGIMLVCASFIFINDKTPFPGLYAFPSVLGAAMVLAGSSGNKLSNVLSSSLLVWIGAVSYSLYLWHWPILAFIRYISGDYQLSFSQTVFYWGGAFMLASISYYLIEQYFRSNQSNARNSLSKFSWGAIISVVALAAIISPNLNRNIVPPLPIELTRYADPATICHGQIVGDCIRGDKYSAEKPILVLGDSHAAMLNYFFDVVGRELKLSFRVITASSCVTISGFDYLRREKSDHAPCIRQIAQGEKYLRDSSIVILAGSWSGNFISNDFKKAFNKFLSSNSNKRIIVFADIPRFKKYKPLLIHRLNFFHFYFNKFLLNDKVDLINNELESIASIYDNVEFVNFTSDSIFENIPYYNKKIIYFDSHHINEYGSVQYAVEVLKKNKILLLDLFKRN